MNIKWFTVVLMLLIMESTTAQTYSSLKGQVSFSSVAPEENITANNNNVAVQLIANTGKGQFIIPIKSFKFKKALLQEHFNENYLESDTYPRASYKYTVTDIEKVDLNTPGKYPVQTAGIITIKGVSKNINVPGYITVLDSRTLRLEASFSVSPADYGIAIPRLVENKIAKKIEINVNSTVHKQ